MATATHTQASIEKGNSNCLLANFAAPGLARVAILDSHKRPAPKSSPHRIHNRRGKVAQVPARIRTKTTVTASKKRRCTDPEDLCILLKTQDVESNAVRL